MKIDKYIVATLLAFAALPAAALANDGTLCGSVRAQGQPLAGARVTIESNSEKDTLVTNARGLYCFAGLHANSHTVRVEKPGYDTIVSQGFVTVSQQKMRLNFITQPGTATIMRSAHNHASDRTTDMYILH
ncbi:MAG: hypothetical protein NVSMB31_09120 [Vulcanimicrobiaceae bacterium]